MSRSRGDDPREIFGPYEVYEQLGVGGMATVHRAKKVGIEGFQRVVALKRMLSHLAKDDSFVQSFVREARLASYLQHANIIQIYDLDLVDKVYYIAMEFVRGRDLRNIFERAASNPIPLSVVVALIRQLCDALDYAHTHTDEEGEPLGIVHRDISPSNLLVSTEGHLKIIDFGISKATNASLRTQSGRLKGKFSYMAPEVLRQNAEFDHRSDIFSVGIVAHELLTGRPLFLGKSGSDTLNKIIHSEVKPPSTYNGDCPPELDEIVLMALTKSPAERWQTAGAMLRALDHLTKTLSIQATNREVAEWMEAAFPRRASTQSERQESDEPRLLPNTRVLGKKSSGASDSDSSVTRPNMTPIGAVGAELIWDPPPSGAHLAVQGYVESSSGPVPKVPDEQSARYRQAMPQVSWPSSPSRKYSPHRVWSSHQITLTGLAPPPQSGQDSDASVNLPQSNTVDLSRPKLRLPPAPDGEPLPDSDGEHIPSHEPDSDTRRAHEQSDAGDAHHNDASDDASLDTARPDAMEIPFFSNSDSAITIPEAIPPLLEPPQAPALSEAPPAPLSKPVLRRAMWLIVFLALCLGGALGGYFLLTAML